MAFPIWARMEPNLSTVRARRAQIAKLRKALDDEDQKLEVAEQVLVQLAAVPSGEVSPTIGVSMASNDGISIGVAGRQPVTQKDLVIATLRTRKDPWSPGSRELANEIEQTHGVTINLPSLLPLLTKLKDNGVIRRDAQNRIALAERVQ
jgi:hypothetical protein